MAVSSALQPGREPSVDRIRKDRDRFVAFAFAGADILIELDAEGTIRFAAGALALIGRSAEELVGSALIDLVDVEDQPALDAVLREDAPTNRIEPQEIGLVATTDAAVRFRMSGYQLAEMNNHFFLTLAQVKTALRETPDAGPFKYMTGMMESDAFAAAAGERLADPDAAMSLIEFSGLAALSGRVSAQDIGALLDGILDHLRAVSIDGDAVAALGGDRVGVIHGRDADIEGVDEAVVAEARAIDPEGEGITVDRTSIALDADGLEEGDAMRALVYTINQFAKNGPTSGLDSLRNGYVAMLNDTIGRIDTFRKLLSDSKFNIAYQPVVDLSDRKVHHYEALVRFGAADQSPFDLITFAEDVDMITSLDKTVCETIIGRVRADQSPQLPVAINLSAKSIQDSEFVSELDAILLENQKLSRQIMFEITESYEIADLAVANRAIQRLRTRGFRVCLDDFGVGATNFDYLRALQVDYVKIDGSYVRTILTEPQAKAFLKAIVHLCDDLGIQTIAEFVEDEETARFLRANRVRYGQGFLFGKPEFRTLDVKTDEPLPA